MTTRFGVKQRPEFTIVDWRNFGEESSGSIAPSQGRGGGDVDAIGKPVKTVTTGEDIDDEIAY
jgi:hypothetical protein